MVTATQIICLVVGAFGLLSVAVRFIMEKRPYGSLFTLLFLYGVTFSTGVLGLLL